MIGSFPDTDCSFLLLLSSQGKLYMYCKFNYNFLKITVYKSVIIRGNAIINIYFNCRFPDLVGGMLDKRGNTEALR